MYNRYIPEDVSYTPVDRPSLQPEPPRSRPRPADRPRQKPFRLPDILGGGEGGLSSLLKGVHLDRIDSGDILLLLIALYLLVEGDDLELALALGLTVLMGLMEG